MWIVSQDGLKILNVETMQTIIIDDGVINIWFPDGKHTALGAYSSHEKALAVRDKLIKTQRGILAFKNIPDENVAKVAEYLHQGKAVLYSGNDSKVEYLGEIVFQMPKDEDVII